MTLTDTDHLAPAVDRQLFRDTLGRFATGVAVATTVAADGAPMGVTVNSFTSVSLDPPMVLFCLDRDASSLPAFVAAQHFAINLLAADQLDLCRRFARQTSNWDDVAYHTWETGAPVIDNSLAAIDCALAHLYEGGDHQILVGRVLRLGPVREAEPLVYHRGTFTCIDRRRSIAVDRSIAVEGG